MIAIDGFIQPNKGRIRSVTMKGTELREYTQVVRIYESILKPYLTATLVMLDNNNLLQNMNIVGGEEVVMTFDSPPNDRVYTQTMNLMSMKGRQSPGSLKSQIYEVTLIGKTYFQDKAALVQKHFGQITGTAAIQQIWNEYLNGDRPLSVKVPSDGFLGKDNDTSTIENLKPFAAINQIKKYLYYGSYKTGVPLLYRDRDAVNLTPLQFLYDSLSSQQTFYQKETWGANFFDPLIYNAIIVAHTDVDTEEGGGRSAIQDTAATINQSQIVFDHFKGTIAAFKPVAKIAAGFGGKGVGDLLSGNLFGLTPGSVGGSPNVQVTQSNRWQRTSAPDNKTMTERRYSAEAREGPQLKIKVPMQTGIDVTVGKGVTCYLMPPSGDLVEASSAYDLSGLWLCKELVHEIYGDFREVQATTTMHLMRGGLG